jgi:hypothetical protein
MLMFRPLTRAAESLLAQSDQHVETEVTISRLDKMLQSPAMTAVISHILASTHNILIYIHYSKLVLKWVFYKSGLRGHIHLYKVKANSKPES